MSQFETVRREAKILRSLDHWVQELAKTSSRGIASDLKAGNGRDERQRIKVWKQEESRDGQGRERALFQVVAAWLLTMARYHGDGEELAVAVELPNREEKESPESSWLHLTVEGNEDREQWKAKVAEAWKKARRHGGISLETLRERLAGKGQPIDFKSMAAICFGSSPAKRKDFGLIALVSEEEDVQVELEYSSGLYSEGFAQLIAAGFRENLERIASGEEEELFGLSREERRLLEEFNATGVEYPRDRTVIDLFEEQVEKNPESIAVVFEEEELTYRELNERANALAHYLRRERGVGPEVRVGLLLERSPEMMVGILGILKAGGAYVPMDPNYPVERINYIVEDAGLETILSHKEHACKAPGGVAVVDLEQEDLYEGEQGNPEPLAGAESLVYIIYTSGSTGRPKGVMIEHRSIVNRLLWMRDQYGIGENDVILQKTTYTFDVSVWELLLPGLVGARQVLLAEGAEKDPEWIAGTVEHRGVTTIHFVPSMLGVFLETLPEGDSRLKSLCRVLCSGEALLKSHQEAFFRKIQGVELHNLYGPTEAAVDVTFCEIKEQDSIISIGRPLANVSAHVMDERQRLAPVGVVGELCFGGVQVARGYINRPELTAEKFIANPYREGERLYRTGDLGRWLPDGTIEYVGRADHQVKIRGYRVELGEIESVLGRQEGVRAAAVVAWGEEGGGRRLVGYAVGEGLERRKVLEGLRSQLPEYMVPGELVELEELPLSANGKVDRKKLPRPEGRTLEEAFEAPGDETERALVAIWEEVLGRKPIGVADNFFELGGDSLKAMQIAGLAHRELGVELKVGKVFEEPTVRGQAGVLRAKGEESRHAELLNVE